MIIKPELMQWSLIHYLIFGILSIAVGFLLVIRERLPMKVSLREPFSAAVSIDGFLLEGIVLVFRHAGILFRSLHSHKQTRSYRTDLHQAKSVSSMTVSMKGEP